METTKIIEVNGVKMELDARTARVQEVQTFKVGDNVMLLKSSGYGERTTKALPGVIVDFVNFAEKPTIVVAYLTDSYRPEIQTAYINKDNSDCALVHTDKMAFDAQYAKQNLIKKVEEREAEFFKAKRDLELFKRFFCPAFEEAK